MTSTVTRGQRADVEKNRQRILTVARTAFAELGLELPMREIARRSGVGVATLYRHFPARSQLVLAVLAGEVELCAADMRSALANPNSGEALRATVRAFAARQAINRGLNDALLGSHSVGAVFAAERREHAEAFAALVDRARRDGALRPGVIVDDARIALRAISSLRALPVGTAAAAITRLTETLLTGLLVDDAAPMPAGG